MKIQSERMFISSRKFLLQLKNLEIWVIGTRYSWKFLLSIKTALFKIEIDNNTNLEKQCYVFKNIVGSVVVKRTMWSLFSSGILCDLIELYQMYIVYYYIWLLLWESLLDLTISEHRLDIPVQNYLCSVLMINQKKL